MSSDQQQDRVRVELSREDARTLGVFLAEYSTSAEATRDEREALTKLRAALSPTDEQTRPPDEPMFPMPDVDDDLQEGL